MEERTQNFECSPFHGTGEYMDQQSIEPFKLAKHEDGLDGPESHETDEKEPRLVTRESDRGVLRMRSGAR